MPTILTRQRTVWQRARGGGKRAVTVLGLVALTFALGGCGDDGGV